MNWADEINEPFDIGEIDDAVGIEVSEKEQALAAQLIESLSADFDPAKYHDTYREQVMALVDQKASGAEPVVTSAGGDASAEVVDLMAALEASVSARAQAKGRHPAAPEKAAAKKAAARKAPARKPAAKKAPAKKPAAATSRSRKSA